MIALFSKFAADTCTTSHFLAFPRWYEYLKTTPYPDCSPQITSLSDVWLIVAAVVDILLRLAALVAVFGVVYGGVLYVTSEGDPERTTKARNVLIYAFAGLIIAIIATALVSFIAGSFGTTK